MSVRKRTASLTLADGGVAHEEVSTVSAGARSRYNGLYGMRVVHDEALMSFSVAVYEVEDIDDDDDETYGRLVFAINRPVSGTMYYPRVESVDAEGTATGEENALPHINTNTVFVDADGGVDAGEVTVELYVKTAGDQRF